MNRFQRHLLPALLTGALMAGLASADECQQIAESTLAEIRAGAGERLDTDTEALIRQAAGAACVKSRSGRYTEATVASSTAVASTAETGNTAGAAAGAAEAGSSEAANSGSSEGGDDDDSWWPFDTFKRNDVSASPSKKPYQRKR